MTQIGCSESVSAEGKVIKCVIKRMSETSAYQKVMEMSINFDVKVPICPLFLRFLLRDCCFVRDCENAVSY